MQVESDARYIQHLKSRQQQQQTDEPTVLSPIAALRLAQLAQSEWKRSPEHVGSLQPAHDSKLEQALGFLKVHQRVGGLTTDRSRFAVHMTTGEGSQGDDTAVDDRDRDENRRPRRLRRRRRHGAHTAREGQDGDSSGSSAARERDKDPAEDDGGAQSGSNDSDGSEAEKVGVSRRAPRPPLRYSVGGSVTPTKPVSFPSLVKKRDVDLTLLERQGAKGALRLQGVWAVGCWRCRRCALRVSSFHPFAA